MIFRNFKQSLAQQLFKRFGDIAFSIIALVFAFPLFVFISLLVKLSSAGPVFYIQERVGRKYSRFGCIKFRTMYAESEVLLSKLLASAPALKQEFERDFKLRDDPRITPIGKFLRRSSLDELPQFVNILLGDMSLVGPRPIVSEEIYKYGDYMEEVLRVKPGLTGLWQVSGRNNLSYQRRVNLDLIYAKNRTLALDIRIIIRTFSVLLLPIDRGAY